MDKTEEKEIKDKLHDMKRKIMILKWDKEKNQLNSGKEVYLKKLEEEYEALKLKIN